MTSTALINMQLWKHGPLYPNEDLGVLATSPYEPPTSNGLSPQTSQKLNNTRETILSQLTMANHTLRSYRGKAPGHAEMAASTVQKSERQRADENEGATTLEQPIVFLEEALQSPERKRRDGPHDREKRERMVSEIHNVQDANQIQLICPSDDIEHDQNITSSDPKRCLDTPNYNAVQGQASTPAAREFDYPGIAPEDVYSRLQSEDTQLNAPFALGSNCFEFKDHSTKSLDDYEVANQPDKQLPVELYGKLGDTERTNTDLPNA